MAAQLQLLEQSRWLFDHLLLMPKHEAWFRREIAIRRAAATTRIEGAELDEEAVGSLEKGVPKAGLSEDELANIGALRAYEFIDYLSDIPDQPIDELVVREINRNMLFGASEVVTAGVYRNGQNTVGSQFTPPDQGDVPDLMRSFGRWLGDSDTTIHQVIRAGLAHLQFVAIHPFWDGNGRTARGLSTLILQRSEFNFKRLLSVESVLLSLRDDYFTAIERTLGNRYSDAYDATPFVEFFVRAVGSEVLSLQGRMTDWHRRMEELQVTLASRNMRQRQVDGLLYAIQTGKITRGDYMQMAKVSPVTASRDLAELVKEGFLKAEGETRNRVYLWVGSRAAN